MLAMQKVEDSSPFSRSFPESPANANAGLSSFLAIPSASEGSGGSTGRSDLHADAHGLTPVPGNGPRVAGAGEALARLYAEQGRNYAADEVVIEGLRHRPGDSRLLRLPTELAAQVSPSFRAGLETE